MSEVNGVEQPVRVLQVVHRMRPGGAQTMIMNLYRQIDKSRVQFDFAVRSRQQEYYDEEIQALGGNIYRLPWRPGNPANIFAYTKALKKLLDEGGAFTAVHAHVGLFNGQILPLAKRAGIRNRIAHSHSASADKYSVFRKVWSQIMRKRISKSATHLLACSDRAAAWLYGDDWTKDARARLFINAIDLSPFEQIHPDHAFWREQTGLPLRGTLIGHIGRFDKVKNHFFLLDVFAKYLAVDPDANLILVGEGRLMQSVKQEAGAKGILEKVHVLGVRSDIPEILGALDCFILPSLHEGLGIVLIEAQAAGVPCLVSDTVPTAVNLGLGLLHYKSLNDGAAEWAHLLQQVRSYQAPTWSKRKTALQEYGYDIQSSAKILQELYMEAR